MDSQNILRRGAKRRRLESSSTVQNQPIPRKTAIILDDTWLEALKHLTCPQWSKMSLICSLVNGIIQGNLSRLPRQVLESAILSPGHFRFDTGLDNVKFPLSRSIQLLYHPASYVKKVTMSIVSQEFIDNITKGEARYIHCDSFAHRPSLDTLGTSQRTAETLNWLERNVRSDSISFPYWADHIIFKNVEARAMLTDFIFDTTRKCKAQELIFTPDYSSDLFYVKFVNILIQDFSALPVVQGTIPTVVINRYPIEEQYRAHLGENLVDREVDSQGAYALYVIENEKKRIRISFKYYYINRCGTLFTEHKAYVKFYTR